jgi:hypothetical protein
LLEPEHERFAEFGAWFTFNELNGTLVEFRRIHPALYAFYVEKLRIADEFQVWGGGSYSREISKIDVSTRQYSRF